MVAEYQNLHKTEDDPWYSEEEVLNDIIELPVCKVEEGD
jgi:hypothetical protein